MSDDAGRLAQALDRAFVILEAAATQSLSFAAVQERLGVGPAATSRLLKGLVTHGLLIHEGESYGAGPRVRAFAERLKGNPDLTVIAESAMRSLAEVTQESAACFAAVDDGIRLIAKDELSERFHYMNIGGVNHGVDRHAGCRLRAAYWDEHLARQHFTTYARGTDVEAWLAEGRELRSSQFLLTPSDDQPGIARAAAAFFDASNNLAGVVVVTGIAAGWNGAHAAHVLAATRRCAHDLSQALGASA